jgi:hypothetical protein
VLSAGPSRTGSADPRPVAEQLGWSDTFDAEYVALTQLEADALITLDRQLADAVKDLVTVAPIEALF